MKLEQLLRFQKILPKSQPPVSYKRLLASHGKKGLRIVILLCLKRVIRFVIPSAICPRISCEIRANTEEFVTARRYQNRIYRQHISCVIKIKKINNEITMQCLRYQKKPLITVTKEIITRISFIKTFIKTESPS